MTPSEKLSAISQTLTADALSELIDFAEFLRTKAGSKTQGLARPLIDLAGGLENSQTFAGDCLAIQQRMRRE